MKIIYNKIFPFNGYKCINLFGFLFVRSKLLKDSDINHEAIHSEQMKEMLWIPFYLWYFFEFIIRWCAKKFDGHEAYRSIWFEREAYAYQDDMDYIKNRKHYKWFRFKG